MKAIARFHLATLPGLLLAAALSLGAAPTPTTTTDELLDALQKSVATPDKTADDARLAPYFSAVKTALTQGRLTEAEQYIDNLRTGLAGKNEAAVPLLDQLRDAIRAQQAAIAAKRDAAVDAIATEAAAKFAARAPATEFDGLLQRLTSLPPVQSQYNDPGAQKIELVRTFLTRAQDYLLQAAAGNAEQAANSLNELIQISTRLPVVPRSQLVALQAEAGKRASAGNDAAIARWETLRKTVETTIDSAKSASDFDAVLAELAKPVATDNYRGYGGNNTIGNQMETLRRFAHRWQDYFSQLEAGNGSGAQNLLRELANDNSSESFYPRSRILARLNGKSTVAPDTVATEPLITPDALTLDNLERFARQTAARRAAIAYGTGDPAINDLATEAARICAAANQFKLGNPQPAIALQRIQTIPNRFDAYTLAFARVQQALVLRALPAYVRAPADLKPADGETPEIYLQRVVRRARDAKDWQLAFRALEAIQTVATPSMGTTAGSSDVEAYRLFFTAMNQERAGQWTTAVRSYFSSLRTDSPNLPAEEIGARLAALKESHSKEYEVAENQPNPVNVGGYLPAGVYPGRTYPPGMIPGVNYPTPQSGRIPNANAPRPAALPAPPDAEPAPAPAATPASTAEKPAVPSDSPAKPAPKPAAPKPNL